MKSLAESVEWAIGCGVILVVVMLVGCGSTAPSGHSVADVKAVAREFADDLEDGQYAMACEALSARERSELEAWPKGGCAGLLRFAGVFAHVGSHRRLGELFQSQTARAVHGFQLKGDIAIYHGHVMARYEDGRWRLEHNGDEALVELSRLKVEIEKVATGLKESGGNLDEMLKTERRNY